MGTIVEKSEYLTETKEKIKESINNIGGDITSETTFREYAQELDNIYDNLPKTTGEDTNLSLNTLKGKMNITPKGDTKQETTQGYNLLEPSFESTSSNNVTITNNGNGTFTLNGTASADTTFVFKRNWSLESNTQYRVSGCPSGGSDDKYFIYSTGASIMGSDTGEGTTMTTGTSAITLAFRIKSGINVSGLIFKPMVTLGTTQKTFEQYTGGTASPNPTYPQNIEVVTGTQEVKVENVNLCDISNFTNKTLSGITFKNNGDGSITLTGTANEFFVVLLSQELTLKANTTYYVSGGISTGIALDLRDISLTGYGTRSTSPTTYGSYTPTSEKSGMYVAIRFESGVTTNVTIKPMLSTKQTDYTPHQEQNYTISLGDIELCKIGTYQDYFYKSNDKWYKKQNIGHKKASEVTTSNLGIADQGLYFNPSFTGVKADKTLRVYANTQTWKNSTDTDWNTLNGNYIGVLYNVQQIYINKSASTITELKTWLDSIGFEMRYVLATPQDIEITNETLIEQLDNLEEMKSYNGTTNISSNGNLPMVLNVSALKGE